MHDNLEEKKNKEEVSDIEKQTWQYDIIVKHNFSSGLTITYSFTV